VLRFHHSPGARLSNPLLDQQRLGDVLDAAGNELRGAAQSLDAPRGSWA
jgi:hypothetical protein